MISCELEVEEDVACSVDDMKTTGCSRSFGGGRLREGNRENDGSGGYEGRPCRVRKAVETPILACGRGRVTA
jgi:hypothetical protein